MLLWVYNNDYIFTFSSVPHNYLGCYQENSSSPVFNFNPGGYRPSRMTPGLCMHACGNWYFKYAALKQGNLCMCSNSTAAVTERSQDRCSVPCFGSGDLKCGGYHNYLSIYKSVTVGPLSLALNSDSPAQTLSVFNITLTPFLSRDLVVESYTVSIGDGYIQHTIEPSASFILSHPGMYYVLGKAKVKHNKTGHTSEIESFSNVTALSNMTELDVFCPSCAPINSSVTCSMKFRYGADVDALVQFDDEGAPVAALLPGTSHAVRYTRT